MLFRKYNKIFTTIFLNIMSVFCIFMLFSFSGCGKNDNEVSISGGRDVMRLPKTTTAGELEKAEDAEGTKAVLINIDTKNQIMVFQKTGSGKKKELRYNGGTDIGDSNGAAMSATQLKIGEVVRISYDKSSGRMEKLRVCSDEWNRSDISGIVVDEKSKTIMIGEDKYTYSDSLIVVSGNSIVDIGTIDAIDVLEVKGNDMRIDSIIVTKGHGYVQLSNTAFYEGGIIEIGDKIITGIEKDMRIKAPEGEYKLTVTKGEVVGTDNIKIDRDEELLINLMDYQEEGKRYGSIAFLITPDNARLYIDKKLVDDYSKVIQLTYGTHSVAVVCEGYKKFETTIDINTTYQSVEVDLKPEETTESSSGSGGENSTTTPVRGTESSTTAPKEGESSKASGKETEKPVQEPTTKVYGATETTKSLADIVSNILIG